MPRHGSYEPTQGEVLVCLRKDGHDRDDKDRKHLVRRSDGVYILWEHDYEADDGSEDFSDFVYIEMAEDEAQEYLKEVS